MVSNIHIVILLRGVKLVKGEVSGDNNVHIASARGGLTDDGQGPVFFRKDKRTLSTVGTFGLVFTLKGIIFSVGRWNPNDTYFFYFHILWLQNTINEDNVTNEGEKNQGNIKVDTWMIYLKKQRMH